MSKPQSKSLTIIGIGSSAGGLEAIRELVATLPVNLDVSYVVVQHMSPHHKSLMTELVARQTELLVQDVEDGTVPKPSVVYITPPKTDVIFKDGKLRLVEPSPELASPKPSVDRFLTSLALEHGENSMGVILSGTGSDGSYGIQAIREAGGITIAQDDESAKYDGMPRSAIQTGCVDLVLRPLDIGTHLQKILSSPRDFLAFRKNEMEETPISDLLQILLARTRVDFREYKQATISRRIERRMVALGIDSQEEYTRFCRTNPQAVDALFKDLLISVTRFFRDKAEFEQLANLLPQLIEAKKGNPLRVWIAGCATGEEAYSIAMLLSEAIGGPKVSLKEHVQIFATDIDKDALQVARRGVYGAGALNDIPKELGDKYLIKQPDGIRVVDSLRSAILFSDHNVCQDPPFQRVDLLCCRNLLIYFGNTLQQKVMSRFHYAMNPDAAMFLGTAESVAGSEDLFQQDKSASHIFRKRVLRGNKPTTYSMPQIAARPRSTIDKDDSGTGITTDRMLFEALARSLGSNSLLVTEDYSIARVYGDISPFIQMNDKSSLKMHLDLLRSPLREEARSLITISLKNGQHRSGVKHVTGSNGAAQVKLEVYPILANDINEKAALVVFAEVPEDKGRISEKSVDHAEDGEFSKRIIDLENEVATTREALQQTIEELETSNEELQSLNEELQSTNEELQATNEELETSNEELQSTNEELITVNEELHVTATELSGRTGELTSVLESTPLNIIVLDSALQVKQVTNAASDLFKIRRPLTNPHVSQCVLPEGYPALAPLCSEALTLGHSTQHEFSSDGTKIIMKCAPYFNEHGKILGVTVVVIEFPGLAQEMEFILNDSQVRMLNRTVDGEILRISEKSAQSLGISRKEALDTNLFDLLHPDFAAEVREQDQKLVSGDSEDSKGIRKVIAANGDVSWLDYEEFVYNSPHTAEPTIYSLATDVTEAVTEHRKAERLLAQIQLLTDMTHIGYWSVDVATSEVFWSSEVYRIHGVTPNDYKPVLGTALDFYHPDDKLDVEKNLQEAIKANKEFRLEKRILQPNGTEVLVETHGVTVFDEAGEVSHIIGVFREAEAASKS